MEPRLYLVIDHIRCELYLLIKPQPQYFVPIKTVDISFFWQVTMMRYIGKTSLTHLMVPREISLPEDYRNKACSLINLYTTRVANIRKVDYSFMQIHGKIHAGTIDRFNEEYAKQDPTRAQTFMDERDQFMISINFLIHFHQLLFLVI